MPEILARFDRNVYQNDSPLADAFIGITSMQTFESLNKHVKNAVDRRFRGNYDWSSILQNAIAIHQPNLFMPADSLTEVLRRLQDPGQHIRPAAWPVSSKPPRGLRTVNRRLTAESSTILAGKDRWLCHLCGLDFSNKTDVARHCQSKKHRENEANSQTLELAHNMARSYCPSVESYQRASTKVWKANKSRQ